MRKGINLKVTFAGKASGDVKSAVAEILKAGRGVCPELKLRTKRVAVDTSGLSLALYIEGEAAPAADFAQLTTKAVRAIVAEGLRLNPRHRLEITDIAEHDVDEE